MTKESYIPPYRIKDLEDTIEAVAEACVHLAGAETINGIKTFNDGIVASRSSSGAIAKLTSEQGDTYLMVERTITGTDPIQAVVENGLTDTKIGTKSNNAVKIITNNTAQVTVGTDGSVVLATDVAANSNNNQVATTKWTTNALSNKANSSEVYKKTEIDAKFQYVTELPASPVEGVTYFILENEE